jgi:NADH-quinone oxidoreductase subunit C
LLGAEFTGQRVSVFALDKVSARFPEAFEQRYDDRSGAHWGLVRPASIRDVASHLKNDPELDFKLFISMDAVDRLQLAESTPRFEIVYFIRSLTRNEVARLKVRASEDAAEVPSLSPIFQGANWWERFIFDFYGVRFTGHPDLRRILMYEEFKGHPLRKDYPLRGRQGLIPERPIKDIFRGPGTNDPA